MAKLPTAETSAIVPTGKAFRRGLRVKAQRLASTDTVLGGAGLALGGGAIVALVDGLFAPSWNTTASVAVGLMAGGTSVFLTYGAGRGARAAFRNVVSTGREDLYGSLK